MNFLNIWHANSQNIFLFLDGVSQGAHEHIININTNGRSQNGYRLIWFGFFVPLVASIHSCQRFDVTLFMIFHLQFYGLSLLSRIFIIFENIDRDKNKNITKH